MENLRNELLTFSFKFFIDRRDPAEATRKRGRRVGRARIPRVAARW